MIEIARDRWRSGRDGARRTASITCPGCDQGLALGAKHEIAADGVVHPSVVCSRGGCTFHDFVKLVGWPPKPPPSPIGIATLLALAALGGGRQP